MQHEKHKYNMCKPLKININTLKTTAKKTIFETFAFYSNIYINIIIIIINLNIKY